MLGVSVLTGTLNSFKCETIVDNAILGFDFQQKWLSTTSMFSHDRLQLGVYYDVVQVVVTLELRCSHKN